MQIYTKKVGSKKNHLTLSPLSEYGKGLIKASFKETGAMNKRSFQGEGDENCLYYYHIILPKNVYLWFMCCFNTTICL